MLVHILIRVTAVLLVVGRQGSAQETRVYVTMFTQNFVSYTSQMYLYISSSRPRPVHVEVYAPFLQSDPHTNMTLDPGNTVKVTLSNEIQMPTGTLTSNRIVRVVADDDVTVLALNAEASNSDLYQVREVSQLSSEYVVVVSTPVSAGSGTIGVVSPYVNTNVTVTLPPSFTTISATIAGLPRTLNREFTVFLGTDDVFQIQEIADLSGTYITADMPIAVLSGVNRSSSAANRCADGQITQLLGVDELGSRYVAFGLPEGSVQDFIQVVSTKPGTSVTFNGTTSTIINAYEKSTLLINRNQFLLVETSSPALVLLSTASGTGSTIQGDMSLFSLRSLPLSGLKYTIPVPNDGYFVNKYLIFMVDSNDVNGILLDDVAITGVTWRQVQGTSLSACYYRINPTVKALVARHRLGRPLAVYFQGYTFCACASLLFHPDPRDVLPKPVSSSGDDRRNMAIQTGKRMTSLTMKTLTVEQVEMCYWFCFLYKRCVGVNFKNTPGPANCELLFTQTSQGEDADWVFYALTPETQC